MNFDINMLFFIRNIVIFPNPRPIGYFRPDPRLSASLKRRTQSGFSNFFGNFLKFWKIFKNF